MSTRQDEDRSTLRSYLLGALPAGERSQLSDRYFVDKDLFDELLDVENELLDQYVHGQLSAEERKNLGNYLTSLPDGTSKLATAYALKEAADEARRTSPAPFVEPSQASTIEAHVSPSRWEILRGSLFGGGYFLKYASVAIGIVLIVSLAYLVVTQRRLRRDLEQQRAERIQTERAKELPSPDAQAVQQNQRDSSEAAERERLRQLELQEAQAREQQKQNTATRGEQSSPGMASLILTPALRSGGTPDVLSVPSSVKTIALIIPVVNGEQITSYRAVLQTTEGQAVLVREGLSPRLSRRAASVTLRIPAARLKGDTFKLTLQGTAADGIEIAQDYYFKVVRK
jgi:hypothetical protein